MVWPFGSSAPKPAQTAHIEQRSHAPLGVVPESESDIAHTLSQISPQERPTVMRASAESIRATNESVTEFVQKTQKTFFVIDGEKYADESIICTNDAQGNKTCLRLKYNSIELFKQMQRLEYFCSLPNDINATYFECRKIT